MNIYIYKYLEQGEAVAEDEIDGSLDEAVFVVMPAHVIVQRVLRPQESAPHEGRRVRRYPERHRLLPHRSRRRHRRRVLECDVLGYEIW